MEFSDHVTALARYGERLANDATTAGLTAEIPSCPDWRMTDLLRHLGAVHRWAAANLRAGGQAEPLDGIEQPPDDELIAWFRAGHAALVADLERAPADVTAWTFLPAESDRAFWGRRQAHETAIHAVDAAIAAGESVPFEPSFAADGIDELVTGWLPHRLRRVAADPPIALTITTTDTGQSWTSRIGPDSRSTSETSDGDATVAGPADQLYRLLWNRGGLEGCTVSGDAAVLARWREVVTV